MATTKGSPETGFLIAIAAAVGATVVRHLLRDILGDTFIFTLYVLPVMLAGWYGGLYPALVATAAGAVFAVTYLVPPIGHFQFNSLSDVVRTVLFVIVGTIVALLCESLHRAEARRMVAEHTRQQTLGNVSDAVFSVDGEGRVLSMNAATRQLLASVGAKPADSVGRRLIEDCFPDLAGSSEEALFRAAIANRTGARFEVHVNRWNRWFNVGLFPEGDGGLSIHGTDITDLRKTEARLRAAIEGANLTAFEWDLRTGEVVRLAESAKGPRWDGPFSLEQGFSTVHPEDRERVREQLNAALSGRAPFFLAEYRSNDNPEQEWCWRRARARVIRDAAGAPVMMSGVSMDISEHKQLEEALREADRRKDNYVAMLAHELRNPLAPIRNAVHLLKAEGPPSSQAAFSHEVIDRQSRHMAMLLDDLLNVSRIARGTLELRREQVGLRTVLASALETAQPHIEARGHQVELRLPDRDPVLHADPSRLAQVFANLLTNAARYTTRGGRISIEAETDGDHVVTTVTDNGIGIAPSELRTIFDLFAQGAPANDESREGMGIGLALARSLVELHAGSLTAKSDGIGRGSQFLVRLPLGIAAGPERPPAVTVPVPEAGEAWRILIADDSHDNANSLAELFRLSGHEVATAYDGEDALAVAVEFQPRAVLLDLGMPRLDGYETCRRLRAMPSEQGLIIIALTGWGQSADREQTSAAGFDAHLVKPVDLDDVLTLVNLLGRNNALPA